MAKYDVERMSGVIHGRLRLGVMAYLAKEEAASFSELKSALNVTQGNLSVQMRKLESAGYVKINKKIVGRRTQTTIRITTKGRKAFSTYLKALSDVLGDLL